MLRIMSVIDLTKIKDKSHGDFVVYLDVNEKGFSVLKSYVSPVSTDETKEVHLDTSYITNIINNSENGLGILLSLSDDEMLFTANGSKEGSSLVMPMPLTKPLTGDFEKDKVAIKASALLGIEKIYGYMTERYGEAETMPDRDGGIMSISMYSPDGEIIASVMAEVKQVGDRFVPNWVRTYPSDSKAGATEDFNTVYKAVVTDDSILAKLGNDGQPSEELEISMFNRLVNEMDMTGNKICTLYVVLTKDNLPGSTYIFQNAARTYPISYHEADKLHGAICALGIREIHKIISLTQSAIGKSPLMN